MTILRFIFGLFFLLIIIMYSVKNLTPVTIEYYNYLFESKTLTVPIIVVIFCSFLVGFIASWMLNIPKIYNLKSLYRKQRREIKKLIKLSDKKDKEFTMLKNNKDREIESLVAANKSKS